MTPNSFTFAHPGIVRFLQDQPLVYASPSGMPPDYLFAHKLALHLENIGWLTDKQLFTARQMIDERNWQEPARFRPFVRQVRERPIEIIMCPGVKPAAGDGPRVDTEIARIRTALGEPDKLVSGTMGWFTDLTRHVNDPRLEPLPSERRRGVRAVGYITPLYQILTMAEAAGTVLQEAA